MSMHVIDRRPGHTIQPGGKNLDNQQRFLRRASKKLTKPARAVLGKGKIGDQRDEELIDVPLDNIGEPSFRRKTTGGVRHHVLPGNKQFIVGDKIKRPDGGGGGAGSEAGGEGEQLRAQIKFKDVIEEWLRGLELPYVRRNKDDDFTSTQPHRSGYSNSGSEANRHIVKTALKAMARRRRPGLPTVEAWESYVVKLEAYLDPQNTAPKLLPLAPDDRLRGINDPENLLLRAREEAKNLRDRYEDRKLVPYMIENDVRYRHFEQKPKPHGNVVIYFVMDISASVPDSMIEASRLFFMLTYELIKRQAKTDNINVVFIPHTDKAKIVPEEEFFGTREQGATAVSTPYEVIVKDIEEKGYTPGTHDIYIAQTTDGDNLQSDNPKCSKLLDKLLPMVRLLAYVEVASLPIRFVANPMNR